VFGLVSLIPVGYLSGGSMALPGVPVVPASHCTFMQNVKVYYPWRNLIKQCVFLGWETEGGVRFSESCWLCVYEDSAARDVACTIILRVMNNEYVLEILRGDGGNTALNLTVEIYGATYYPFRQGPSEENIGYATLKYENPFVILKGQS
jgi:hypothetical protein